ncbi:MAG: AbrB/MazE/SpoVT family DNA-binding domain-containing protein [Thermodesulfobacteriota bacterium]|nr:AbrB/MazE/SpoVT family DNA-binding domain-containing protein [Thermodesulfobacteriota bacterium]
MPKVTTKGQITIPQDIRNRFGFFPGIEVDIVYKDNKALIVKSARENVFLKWLGRGKVRRKEDIDLMVNEFRGRTDE